MQKIRKGNFGHRLQLAQVEKHHCICIKKYESQNYLKMLEESIEEMNELRDISRGVLFLQIDNT